MIQPCFIAHRGFDLCHPENTMHAFGRVLEARDNRVRGIELDVRLTRDGRVVVFHDAGLLRLGGSWRRIASSAYTIIRDALHNNPRFRGHHIPLLEELLGTVDHRLLVNIELKHHRGDPFPLCRAVHDILTDYRPRGDIILSAFSPDALAASMRLSSGLDLRFGFLFSSMGDRPAFRRAIETADTLHPAFQLLEKKGRRLSRIGKPLFPWTVNTDEELRMVEKSPAYPLVEGIITGNSRLADQK